jgi:hypothetical protein
MADGFITNSASGGATFASDDDGTWQWPLIKLAWGGNGAFNYAALAAPVPVQSSDESSQMTAGGTVVTPKFATIAASSSGNNTIVAAVTSKKIRVLAAVFMSNGTVNAKFQSGAGGTDLSGLFYMVANTGAALPYNPAGWFETGSNTLLNLNLSAAIAVGGCITYIEV